MHKCNTYVSYISTDGNGNKKPPQDNDHSDILDNKIKFSTGSTDAFSGSRGFESVWYLHLVFVILLLLSNMMLMLINSWGHMMENHQYNKITLCHFFKKTVNTIRRVIMIGIILLCIAFQITVALVKQYTINTTAAEKLAVECTLMSLSVVIFAVCIFIFCKYRVKEKDVTPIVPQDGTENKPFVA